MTADFPANDRNICSHCILSLDIRFMIVLHLGHIELSGLIRTMHCLHAF